MCPACHAASGSFNETGCSPSSHARRTLLQILECRFFLADSHHTLGAPLFASREFPICSENGSGTQRVGKTNFNTHRFIRCVSQRISMPHDVSATQTLVKTQCRIFLPASFFSGGKKTIHRKKK